MRLSYSAKFGISMAGLMQTIEDRNDPTLATPIRWLCGDARLDPSG